MENSQKLVSIIIPAYNSCKLLLRSVKSALAQTYANIEVVVVNDGSTDGSAEKIDRFSKADARVVAVRQANHGVSVARNEGIKRSKGELLLFLDADDLLLPTAVADLAKAMEETDADMVAGSVRVIKKGKLFSTEAGNEPMLGTVSDQEFMAKLPECTSVQRITFKLFKRALFDFGFVVNANYGEDTEALYRYFLRAKTLCYITPFVGQYYVNSQENNLCSLARGKRFASIKPVLPDIMAHLGKLFVGKTWWRYASHFFAMPLFDAGTALYRDTPRIVVEQNLITALQDKMYQKLVTETVAVMPKDEVVQAVQALDAEKLVDYVVTSPDIFPKKFPSSPRAMLDIITKNYGLKGNFVKVPTARGNHVYENGEVFVKLATGASLLSQIENEKNNLRALTRLGFVDYYLHGGRLGAYGYIITKKVPGVPLRDIYTKLTSEQKDKIIEKIAIKLRALHALNIGRKTENEEQELIESAYKEALQALPPNLLSPELSFVGSCLLPAIVRKQVLRFTHGDLHLGNILVDGDTVEFVDYANAGVASIDRDGYTFARLVREVGKQGASRLVHKRDLVDAEKRLRRFYPEMYDFAYYKQRVAIQEFIATVGSYWVLSKKPNLNRVKKQLVRLKKDIIKAT